jgi:integrase
MPVYKDDVRNTWYALFYYTDWTGVKRRKKKRGFKLQRDAKDFEADFLARQTMSTDMTFAALVEIYNDDMHDRLRLTTRKTKSFMMNTHILPFFKDHKVNAITSAHVRKWQAELLAKGYAPTYLKSINSQLVAVMNYAVRYYGLEKNPCYAAGPLGKKDADAMLFWTHDEFSQFIQCVRRRPAKIGFELLFWTGMRISELLALTEHNFDFVRGGVNIELGYQRVDGEDIMDDPKTEKSRRHIPLPAAIIEMVQEYIKRLYDYKPGDRLFPYTKGYFHNARDKACTLSGVKHIRIHDIRHSHAALLIDMDVPILLISERLGHEDVKTTLRTYGHLYPHRHGDAVARMNELIKGTGSPPEQ